MVTDGLPVLKAVADEPVANESIVYVTGAAVVVVLVVVVVGAAVVVVVVVVVVVGAAVVVVVVVVVGAIVVVEVVVEIGNINALVQTPKEVTVTLVAPLSTTTGLPASNSLKVAVEGTTTPTFAAKVKFTPKLTPCPEFKIINTFIFIKV